MAAPDIIQLVNSEGEVAPFKAKDAETALHQGWKVATPESVKAIKDASGFVGGTKALLEGGARGLTAGLSDVAESKLGISTPAAIEARRGAHPYLSTLGSVAGGVGLAAGAATGLGALGLGGLGGALATGALSGGVEGAGGELSQQLLENKGLRGEEIAHHALVGTLLGTLGAAGGEALGAGIRGVGRSAAGLSEKLGSVAEKLRGESEELAPGLAEQRAVAGLANKNQLFKLSQNPEQMTMLGRKILDEGALAGNARAAHAANQAALREAGASIENSLLTSEAPVSSETVGSLVDGLRKLGSKAEFETKVPVWKKRLRLLADHLEETGTDPEVTMTARQLHAARSEVDRLLEPYAAGKPIPRELAQARALVNEHLSDAMGPEFAAANAEYGLRKEYGKLLKNAVTKEITGDAKAVAAASAGGGGFNFGDILDKAKSAWEPIGAVGALATGHPIVAAGLAGKYAVGKVGDYLAANPGMLANMADAVGSSEFLRRVAQTSDVQWSHGIGTLIGGTTAGEVGAAGHIPSVSDYGKLSSMVQAAAENPTHVAANVTSLTGQLNTTHPEIADNAAATSQRAIQYLNSQLPKSPLPNALLDTVHEPSHEDKANWLEAYRTVMHPASAFTHPTEASMNTLKAVYPAMYAAAQQRLLTQLQGKSLSYQQQLKLAKVMGANVSTLTSPEFTQGMQRILQPPEHAPPSNQKGSARTAAATRAKERKLNFKASVEGEQTQLSRMMAQD